MQKQKQIDWQFHNEIETTTIADFKKMIRNGEKAPHISFEEFYNITDEWLVIH